MIFLSFFLSISLSQAHPHIHAHTLTQTHTLARTPSHTLTHTYTQADALNVTLRLRLKPTFFGDLEERFYFLASWFKKRSLGPKMMPRNKICGKETWTDISDLATLTFASSENTGGNCICPNFDQKRPKAVNLCHRSWRSWRERHSTEALGLNKYTPNYCHEVLSVDLY